MRRRARARARVDSLLVIVRNLSATPLFVRRASGRAQYPCEAYVPLPWRLATVLAADACQRCERAVDAGLAWCRTRSNAYSRRAGCDAADQMPPERVPAGHSVLETGDALRAAGARWRGGERAAQAAAAAACVARSALPLEPARRSRRAAGARALGPFALGSRAGCAARRASCGPGCEAALRVRCRRRCGRLGKPRGVRLASRVYGAGATALPHAGACLSPVTRAPRFYYKCGSALRGGRCPLTLCKRVLKQTSVRMVFTRSTGQGSLRRQADGGRAIAASAPRHATQDGVHTVAPTGARAARRRRPPAGAPWAPQT